MSAEGGEAPARYVGVPSPNAPRPAHEKVRWLADTLARIERNYEREGSGPGSRFEGRLLEDVQAETIVRLACEWCTEATGICRLARELRR